MTKSKRVQPSEPEVAPEPMPACNRCGVSHVGTCCEAGTCKHGQCAAERIAAKHGMHIESSRDRSKRIRTTVTPSPDDGPPTMRGGADGEILSQIGTDRKGRPWRIEVRVNGETPPRYGLSYFAKDSWHAEQFGATYSSSDEAMRQFETKWAATPAEELVHAAPSDAPSPPRVSIPIEQLTGKSRGKKATEPEPTPEPAEEEVEPEPIPVNLDRVRPKRSRKVATAAVQRVGQSLSERAGTPASYQSFERYRGYEVGHGANVRYIVWDRKSRAQVGDPHFALGLAQAAADTLNEKARGAKAVAV